MAHVSRSYDAVMEPSESAQNLGYRKSAIHDVMELVRCFEEVVGTDLVTPTTRSHLWYSDVGRCVSADAPDIKYTQPWAWIWRVAEGRSLGEMAAKAEPWDAAVESLIKQDSMFFM